MILCPLLSMPSSCSPQLYERLPSNREAVWMEFRASKQAQLHCSTPGRFPTCGAAIQGVMEHHQGTCRVPLHLASAPLTFVSPLGECLLALHSAPWTRLTRLDLSRVHFMQCKPSFFRFDS